MPGIFWQLFLRRFRIFLIYGQKWIGLCPVHFHFLVICRKYYEKKKPGRYWAALGALVSSAVLFACFLWK